MNGIYALITNETTDSDFALFFLRKTLVSSTAFFI